MLNRSILFLFFIALLTAFLFQGTRGLYETSEGRYAECAREMIESGNYIEPTIGYKAHWSNPPLTYWALAAGIKGIGRNTWGVRIPNALAFFLTVFIVFYAGLTLWDKQTGFTAGLIYATSLFPVFGASYVTSDTILTLWEVCAVLCYIRAIQNPPPTGKKSWWVIGMWLFFGLGFLTKGPFALLPLIPIILWQILCKPGVKLFNRYGILIFLLTGLSWYFIVISRHHGLLSYFLGKEVAGRISSGTGSNPKSHKALVIFLPALILGQGPWLYYGIKWIRQKFKFKTILVILRGKTAGLFLILWILIPLILLSALKSRIWLYVLPLYAPVALGIARAAVMVIDSDSVFRKFWKTALITALVLVGVKWASAVYPYKSNMKQLYTKCESLEKKGDSFIIYSREGLFGLQYYLNRNIDRFSPGGKGEFSRGKLDDMIGSIKAAGSLKTFAIIVSKQDEPAVETAFKAAGINFELSAEEGNRDIISAHIPS